MNTKRMEDVLRKRKVIRKRCLIRIKIGKRRKGEVVDVLREKDDKEDMLDTNEDWEEKRGR